MVLLATNNKAAKMQVLSNAIFTIVLSPGIWNEYPTDGLQKKI
jgi:hypothetical protein